MLNPYFPPSQAEIIAIIGHNGAGKSTLLKALFGVIPMQYGFIEVEGRRVAVPTPRALLPRGISYVPQGNRVFGELTVRENLELGGVIIANKRLRSERIQQMLAEFPVLGARMRQKAATLSGGEKQMLALANAMVLQPRILLLDEPSLGLSPIAASDALGYLARVRGNGASVLVIEQKVRDILKIARRVKCCEMGRYRSLVLRPN